ncbi:MAG: hypothetical protein ABJG68_06440 [Crocinitomicaceae bacterium]
MIKFFPILFILAFFSCGAPESNAETDEVFTLCEEPTLEDDTLSFNYFLSKFQDTQLPYHQKENDLWDGEIFYDEQLKEFDYETPKIPYYLLKKWLMNEQNALAEELKESSELLEKNDDWHMVQAGIHFSEQESEFILIHYYEKISASNGAYWTSYLLEFEKEGKLVECIELGKEGIYSFTISEETEDSFFWARHTDILGLNITISASNEIEVCTTKRYEIEGDLTKEESNMVDGVNITNDSLGTWTQIFPEDCVEY